MIGDDELRAVIDRLPTGVVAVDPGLRVTYANAAAAGLLPPESLRVGEKVPASVFDSEFQRSLRDLFTDGARPFERALAIGEKALATAGFPAGRVAAVFIDDVSDRNPRGHARDDFVTNAAHELLTPLTGIASAAHVLEAGAKEVPEMRDRFLHLIARECNRLTRIARGLLVLARAQSGQEPPALEPVDLRPLLSDVLDANDVRPDGLDCPDDLRVFVDRDLVEAALSNLVANAIRHSRNRTVSLGVEAPKGDMIEIVIANGGHESAAPDMERFKTRFATGIRRDGSGFGLGISIAADALHAVGGTLTFEFEDNQTLARVALPTTER